ncbi:rhodanese-like domain-containing protein [Salinisphaera aquimarina]|uniref:Rhodanese-like domain-containing protein n=1 Tax=Salinisphaera aquimarina TaxID=2094031 RepID=A0ABV7EUI6_9GAMM
MPVNVSAQELVARANARITALSPTEVVERRRDPGVLLVDIRDVRERKREGAIAGALHVPRGMLEFWVDPDSPYHKPALAEADSLILHCNKGWRSALAAATLQDMGCDNVAHMAGGFDRWRDEIGDVEPG